MGCPVALPVLTALKMYWEFQDNENVELKEQFISTDKIIFLLCVLFTQHIFLVQHKCCISVNHLCLFCFIIIFGFDIPKFLVLRFFFTFVLTKLLILIIYQINSAQMQIRFWWPSMSVGRRRGKRGGFRIR